MPISKTKTVLGVALERTRVSLGQVGEALWRILRFHQIGVAADGAEQPEHDCVHAVQPFGPFREPQWLALPPINLEKLQECLLLVETWRLTAIRSYQIENVRWAVETP